MISSQLVDLPSWLLILLSCLRGLATVIRLATLAHRALRHWHANRRRQQGLLRGRSKVVAQAPPAADEHPAGQPCD